MTEMREMDGFHKRVLGLQEGGAGTRELHGGQAGRREAWCKNREGAVMVTELTTPAMERPHSGPCGITSGGTPSSLEK